MEYIFIAKMKKWLIQYCRWKGSTFQDQYGNEVINVGFIRPVDKKYFRDYLERYYCEKKDLNIENLKEDYKNIEASHSELVFLGLPELEKVSSIEISSIRKIFCTNKIFYPTIRMSLGFVNILEFNFHTEFSKEYDLQKEIPGFNNLRFIRTFCFVNGIDIEDEGFKSLRRTLSNWIKHIDSGKQIMKSRDRHGYKIKKSKDCFSTTLTTNSLNEKISRFDANIL